MTSDASPGLPGHAATPKALRGSDRNGRSGVYTGMRALAAMLVSAGLSAAAACGGAQKTDTTPKPAAGSGSGDPASMGTTTDPSATTPASGNDGAPGTQQTTAQPTTASQPSGPPIVPPNLDPDPAQARSQVDQHLGIAKQYLQASPPDADGALREAKQALAIDATSVDAAAMIAFAYYHKHLYDTAEIVLDDVFKRDAAKKNANIYYIYGLVYDHTNRADQARLAFETAVQLDGNFASALVDLGEHQLENKQYGDATITFERLTGQLRRNDAVTWTSLGSSYRGKSGDLQAGDSQRDRLIETAESSYKKALGINPGYGPAYYNLGLLYLDSDPYPGMANAIDRVNTAKQYFDQYKATPGSDGKLYDERVKDINKLLKRLQKKPPKAGKAGKP
jgi:tetratricopeptide (TPR) repeat protein